MAIKKDHSALPTGNPPNPNPRFGPLLAQAWADENVSDEPFAMPVWARLRASWAGKCSRDITYRVQGVTPSNPPGLASFFRMGTGTLMHEALQPAIDAAFPGASIEHITDWERLGLPGASHVDVYLVDQKTVLEIKTVGGWAFKKAIGARGPAEGPKFPHILQAALSAKALDATSIAIIYLAMENLSPYEANKIGADEIGRFCAEWDYPMSALSEMVDREIVRLGRILEISDAGGLAPRFAPGDMPPGARVNDPMNGTWTLERGGSVLEAGKYWPCAEYCDFRDQCAKDGAS